MWSNLGWCARKAVQCLLVVMVVKNGSVVFPYWHFKRLYNYIDGNIKGDTVRNIALFFGGFPH